MAIPCHSKQSRILPCASSTTARARHKSTSSRENIPPRFQSERGSCRRQPKVSSENKRKPSSTHETTFSFPAVLHLSPRIPPHLLSSSTLTLQVSSCLPPSADQDRAPGPPPPPKPTLPKLPVLLEDTRGDSLTRDKPSKPPTTPCTGGLPSPRPTPGLAKPPPPKPQGLGMKLWSTSPTIFKRRAWAGGAPWGMDDQGTKSERDTVRALGYGVTGGREK